MQGSISTFLLATLKIYLAFLRTKIGLIVGVTALGAALGFTYVSIKPIKYTARSSFVVEDSKSLGGSGLMGAISGQLGPELLGALGGSNLLSGENIIELAKVTGAVAFHSSARKNISSKMQYINKSMNEELLYSSLDSEELTLMKKNIETFFTSK